MFSTNMALEMDALDLHASMHAVTASITDSKKAISQYVSIVIII